MRRKFPIIPLWVAASIAGLAAILIVGSIPAVKHCAFGMGILAAYLISKYYAHRERIDKCSQAIKKPDATWLNEKQLAMENIVNKQTADLGRKRMAVQIDVGKEGLATVFARKALRGHMLISARAISERSQDELDFLICNAILCDRSAYWQTVNIVMTGIAFVILLYLSEYIHTTHLKEFLWQSGIMLGLIALVWTIYGTGARVINNKREWALKTAMDYTGKPLQAATVALSSSTFKDIPEGIRLRLEEIRRLGFIPQGDGDLDWLQNN